MAATDGIPVPADYPTEIHNRVAEALHTKFHDVQFAYWQQANWALQGVLYRFTACAEHDDYFTNSYAPYGTPAHPERFNQEKHLFDFFSTGLSCLECLAYLIWNTGAALRPVDFPVSERALRSVSVGKAADKLAAIFPHDAITLLFCALRDSVSLQDWTTIRNVVMHRSHPGRVFSVIMGGAENEAWFNGLPINTTTTRGRRQWLAAELMRHFEAVHQFLVAH